jgi:actin-like ATPase involved in cell morphogenesis
MLHDATSRQSVRQWVARDLGNQSLYHIAGRDYSPSQVTSLILNDMRERAKRKAGQDFAHFAIAYPVWFDALAVTALRGAATDAGLINATLTTQAQAVTAAFRRAGSNLAERVLVIDIGAASTDLSVLALDPSGEYAVANRPRTLTVGGNVLDHLLYIHVAEAAKREVGHVVLDDVAIDLGALHVCRLAKESLSRSDGATFEHTAQNGSATALHIPLTRADLERLARPKLDEVFRAASEILAAADDRGRPVGTVILTGGGTLMPLAQQLAHVGLPVDAVLVDRDCTAAAVGAALTAVVSAPPIAPKRNGTVGPIAPIVSPIPASAPGAIMPPDDFDEIPPELKAELDVIRKKIAEARARRFTFMLVGRTGVGKSSTLNSLFGWKVAETNRYERQTPHVSVYTKELGGIPFSIIDTPGLCDEDSDKGSDLQYLEEMRTVGQQIDSLWFVTRLNETRLASDEKLTIKLISESFTPEIWKYAVIVFTHADRAERFSEAFSKRSELVRREIARHAGPEIAGSIPTVAVDNTSHLTPDGKMWRSELYSQTFMKVSRESLLSFAIGTVPLLRPRQRPRGGPSRDNVHSRWTSENGGSFDGIELSEQQERQLGERIHRESLGDFIAGGAVGVGVVGAIGFGLSEAVAGAAAGAIGGPLGIAVGALIGGTAGVIKGALAGAAAGGLGGAVVGYIKRLFGRN